MSVVYEDANGTVKEYKSVYNDIRMNCLDTEMKKLYSYASSSTRQVLLREMLTRIQSIVIAKTLGMLEDDSDHFSSLNSIIENKTDVMKKFKDLGHSLFESILLAWACMGR